MSSRSLALVLGALSLSLAVGPTAASASTADAWNQFRRDVETACRAGVEGLVTDPQVVVDPFGLERHGLAVINGPSTEDGEPASLICIYDKTNGHVEVGGTLVLEAAIASLMQSRVAPAPNASALAQNLLSPSALAGEAVAPVIAPGAPLTVPTMAGPTLGQLSEEDRTELLGLSAQIERTVAANSGASLGAGPGAARAAAERAARIAEGRENEDLVPTAALAGQMGCTLYYFGYQGEASRTVGTHRCSVSEGEDGALLVEKTSGERLRAELRPFADGVSAFVGRSFQPDHAERDYDPENPDNAASDAFGNAVGLAVEEEGRLYLVSSQRRRFEASDSFFWVLAFEAP